MSKNISLDEIKKFWPDKAPDINIVQKYIKKYENEKIVIKYGGNVLIDRNVFNNFISDINVLNKLGLSIIVVHGGGPRIKRELDKKKIVSKFINGLRVTDKNIIDTVEEVLIDFNKDIASSLKKLGSQAAMFHSKADNIIEVEPEREELGFVGIPNKINDSLILNALNENKIPIIAPLGLGKNEQTYNINGDTAASAIAKKLKSRRLILMTNVEGVYDDKKKLISEIKPYDLENLIKWKVVQGGMIPKIENCVDAVQNGVRGVVILDGRKPHSILHEIFSDQGSGTLIRE
ncbi:acetylglutamate kinase [Candidatus Pelagibacter bacterium]|nr:acetylglutamate kinase [Candidatus Pelagibacter bacterium]